MSSPTTLSESATDRQERRRSRRYSLSLPATVRAAGHDSVNGRSRDVSTSGAYLIFDAQDNLAPGTELDLTLTLRKEVTSSEDVLVRAHGKTVRVDSYGDNDTKTTGIAVVFESHHFLRSGAANR